ncbi:MAG TPA: cystathionine gamma-synthase family protein [Hyphomonadaceae bacterium]|nr:cystathionine gamma-synthase family protein [Hyphomonadaceae bacterium]
MFGRLVSLDDNAQLFAFGNSEPHNSFSTATNGPILNRMTRPPKSYRSKKLGDRELSPETLMMGYGYAPSMSEGALKPPLFQTSTFVFRNAEEGKASFELAYGLREKKRDEEMHLIYSRINNPNLEVLEDRLAVWDGAEKALAFASGMAAISTTLMTFLRPGDSFVFSEPVYGGTEFLIHTILPQFGAHGVGFMAEGGEAGFREAAKQAAALAAKNGGKVGAIYVETPANPTNGLVDICVAREISETLKGSSGRPPVIVDNTFLGPLWQKPLSLGADICVTSLTKYVGGHSDLIAGAASGGANWIGQVAVFRTIFGTMTDPHTAWLLLRSLETLKLRMDAAELGARKVAAYLQTHPRVKSVWYLGFLPADHPDRPLFERQCVTAGSTFSFEIDGGEKEAFAFLDKLQIIKLAVSLGGTETLASHPAAMTHSDVPKQSRERLGITESLVRLSIGVENPDDLIADIAQALEV